uniref:Hes family bHLH transcription factor 1 n=1 Tax=Athene cunicularia TaxID=194338 RepID=A0A663N1M7_ATHCN
MTLSLLFIFLFLNSEGSAGKPLQRRGLCTGEICKHVSSFLNFIFLTVSEKARSGDMCGIGPVQVQIRYWRRWKNITVRCEPHLCPQSSRHSKLEKADILEMTVKHLRSLQRAQMTAALSTDPTVLGKYRAGFSECMNEVTRFLSTCEGVNTEVRTRLLGHLASCMTQINAMNYPAPPPPPPLPPAAPGADAAKVYGGFQLLPASDGQFAFLIPSTAFAPGGAVLPLYGGPPTAATAASPPGPPPGTADSVWRPW